MRSVTFTVRSNLRALEQVVSFFDRGGDVAGQYPGMNELTALGLSELEKSELLAFLRALGGPGPSALLLEPPR